MQYSPLRVAKQGIRFDISSNNANCRPIMTVFESGGRTDRQTDRQTYKPANRNTHTHACTRARTFNGPFSGTTWVKGSKVKPISILLKQSHRLSQYITYHISSLLTIAIAFFPDRCPSAEVIVAKGDFKNFRAESGV